MPFRPQRNDESVAFLQAGGEKTGADKSKKGDGLKTNKKGESHCFNCKAEDHWANECPELNDEQRAQLRGDRDAQLHMHIAAVGEEDNTGVNAMMLSGVSMLQQGKRKSLDPMKGYLDGCSTVSLAKAKNVLSNIRKADNPMHVSCNAGVTTLDEVGDYGGMEMYFPEDGIANIFSIPQLKKMGFRITYDSDDGYYVVHTKKGPIKFWEDENGLPCIDLQTPDWGGSYYCAAAGYRAWQLRGVHQEGGTSS